MAAPPDSVDVSYYDRERDLKDRDAYYKEYFSKERTPFMQLCRLRELLGQTHKHKLGYNPSQYLYKEVDLRPNHTLASIYGTRFDEQCQKLGLDPVQIGLNLAAATAEGWNCEHAVPRVWFGDEAVQRGDLHHLFTSDQRMNSLRSDFPLGETPGCFNPLEGKGPLARATFYCLIRYPKCVGTYNSEDLATLKRWSQEDPVSDYERHRNSEIFHLQGNRNPFIDFPELAQKLDFSFL